MKKIIFIILICSSLLGFSQSKQQISLRHCIHETGKNYPLSNQKELIKAANELSQGIIQSGFLPQLTLNAQVSCQSEVTSLPFSMPNVSMPQISKDWYKLNIDVSQLIYDGGALKKQQAISISDAEIEQKSIEIELYKVKQVVQTTYFNILLLNENKKTMLLLQNELEEKLRNIESGVKNGVILPANRDNLKAELIKIDQHLFELDLGIESAVKNLNILTGLQLTKNDTFLSPQTTTNLSFENNRPELGRFDTQISKLNLMKPSARSVL